MNLLWLEVPHPARFAHSGMRWLLEQFTIYRAVRQRALEEFLPTLDEKAFRDTLTSCLPKTSASKKTAKPKSGLNTHAPTGSEGNGQQAC